MPTFGWVLEDAVERFWESRPGLDLIFSDPEQFICSLCGMTFGAAADLRKHLSLVHPLELPALYVRGKALQRQSYLRSALKVADVELFQCSHCMVQRDGGAWQHLSVSEFQAEFCRPTNATWNIQLFHKRAVDNSRIMSEFEVRFRIPDAAALNTVDELFLEILVRDELQHSHLSEYRARLPQAAPVREYGAALGDYALGIILKEQRRKPYAPVEFAQFAHMMRTALETLSAFSRPVALAVVSSICFNLNNFHDYAVVAPTQLAPALQFFRSVSSAPYRDLPTLDPALRSVVTERICPIDHISHRLIRACTNLADNGSLSAAELSELQRMVDGSSSISAQDLAKIRVLCAEGYLRIAQFDNARTQLRAIRADPSFRDWALRQLEEV